MTKKLVDESLKSPALVGNIATYHKELIANTAKRGVLVILSCLFLGLQYVSILYPTQSANNADLSSDAILGGFTSKQDMLRDYDSKKSSFYKSAEALSISREDIVETTEQSLGDWMPNRSSLLIAWSTSPVATLSFEDSSRKDSQHFVALDSTKKFRYFGHVINTKSTQKSNLKGMAGQSKEAGKFIVLKNSGNFITTTYNADICYKDPDRSLSHTLCPTSNSFQSSIKVINTGYKTEAQFIKNRPNDMLQYELSLENKGTESTTLRPEIFIGDILEYARLTNVDNARYDNATQTLQWPSRTIAAGEKIYLGFGVQIVDTISIAARGATNGSSFDCYLTSFFGEISNVKIACSTPKILERMLSAPAENSLLAVSWLIAIVNALLWLRSYLLSKEYGLIVKKVRSKNA